MNLKTKMNNMRQFNFDNNDIKAFGILGLSIGLKWTKVQKNLKNLLKNFT